MAPNSFCSWLSFRELFLFSVHRKLYNHISICKISELFEWPPVSETDWHVENHFFYIMTAYWCSHLEVHSGKITHIRIWTVAPSILFSRFGPVNFFLFSKLKIDLRWKKLLSREVILNISSYWDVQIFWGNQKLELDQM